MRRRDPYRPHEQAGPQRQDGACGGFDNGRYRVHLCLPPGLGSETVTSGDKFIGVKPANLVLVPGTARDPPLPAVSKIRFVP